MCARYSIGMTEKQVRDLFNLDEEVPLEARYNVAPTQEVPGVVRELETQKRHLEFFRWGLIPPWAGDMKIGQKLINARAETIFEKPSFRSAARHRRMLVPAAGFYEWKTENGKKQPYFFRLKSGQPMAFGGIWESKRISSGHLRTCSIVTTGPNEVVMGFHDRMPAVIRQEDFDHWLDPKVSDPKELLPILVPFPAEEMECFPVSPEMNKVTYESPDCASPIWGEKDETPSLF